MSTTYYALRRPIARLIPMGTVVDLKDAAGAFVGVLHRDHLHLAADRDETVAHRSGNTIRVTATGSDAEQAVSEYGELVTLGELRKGRAP